MEIRPGSSQRMGLTPPPPSRALLELQKQGLEIATSPPSNPARLVPSRASARSTPSDLDKPLPLEPLERARRSSSVYSTDTTISNIIHMYGGYHELFEDLPLVPQLHHPQAYRDTVAPLLIKRLSLSPSPAHKPTPAPAASISNLSLRSTLPQSQGSPATPKNAPSFLEFSRGLQERRNEMVSPLSSVATPDHHRQTTYNVFSTPSPQVSSVELSISVAHTPPLPEAMSATISNFTDSDLLLPPPPDLQNATATGREIVQWDKYASGVEVQSLQDPESEVEKQRRSTTWSGNWLQDDVEGASLLPESKDDEQQREDSLKSEEKDRIMSYAIAKYPGMGPNKIERSPESQRLSTRSVISDGMAGLLRSVSGKQHPAIPKTPYQIYGEKVFKDERKKATKQEKGKWKPHSRRQKSKDLSEAYQSGQNQLISVFKGAKHKLTRRPSADKRRKTIKQSITMVGAAETKSTQHALDRLTGKSHDPYF